MLGTLRLENLIFVKSKKKHGDWFSPILRRKIKENIDVISGMARNFDFGRKFNLFFFSFKPSSQPLSSYFPLFRHHLYLRHIFVLFPAAAPRLLPSILFVVAVFGTAILQNH